MNVRRLNILRTALFAWKAQGDAARPLDMSHWTHEVRLVRRVSSLRYAAVLECGSACCALGFAASEVPEFQAEGLWLRSVDDKHGTPVFTDPVTRIDYAGFEAAQHFFGLPPSIAGDIFSAESYPSHPERITLDDVISRVGACLVPDLIEMIHDLTEALGGALATFATVQPSKDVNYYRGKMPTADFQGKRCVLDTARIWLAANREGSEDPEDQDD